MSGPKKPWSPESLLADALNKPAAAEPQRGDFAKQIEEWKEFEGHWLEHGLDPSSPGYGSIVASLRAWERIKPNAEQVASFKPRVTTSSERARVVELLAGHLTHEKVARRMAEGDGSVWTIDDVIYAQVDEMFAETRRKEAIRVGVERLMAESPLGAANDTEGPQ